MRFLPKRRHHAGEVTLQREVFLWAVGALCQLNRIPFDVQLLLRQFTPPFSLVSLQQALTAFGLHGVLKPVDPRHLSDVTLPALAVLKVEPVKTEVVDGEEGAPASTSAETTSTDLPTHTLALLLKLDGDQALILDPGAQQPRSLSLTEFTARYDGRMLLVKKQAEAVTDEDTEPQQFGFRWFIPELLKYRRIWTEVLLASFAIQLVGLAVPVCTQIVIDKVVVHHTVSTLIVIAVALFALSSSMPPWVGYASIRCSTPATVSTPRSATRCSAICSICPCAITSIAPPAWSLPVSTVSKPSANSSPAAL